MSVITRPPAPRPAVQNAVVVWNNDGRRVIQDYEPEDRRVLSIYRKAHRRAMAQRDALALMLGYGPNEFAYFAMVLDVVADAR